MPILGDQMLPAVHFDDDGIFDLIPAEPDGANRRFDVDDRILGQGGFGGGGLNFFPTKSELNI